jgi:predicted P-loop ATPase/GTPase
MPVKAVLPVGKQHFEAVKVTQSRTSPWKATLLTRFMSVKAVLPVGKQHFEAVKVTQSRTSPWKSNTFEMVQTTQTPYFSNSNTHFDFIK